jgi:DNA-binding CsgD family transcriptional regulator
VAKLAAFGLSNKEISARMGMSLSAVKQALLSVTDKTGVSRDEFAGFL